MKICEKCQTPLSDDAMFCTKCGAKVSAPSPAPAPAKSKKHNPYLIATAVAVVAILIGVAFYFVGRAEGEKNSSRPGSTSSSTSFGSGTAAESDASQTSTSNYSSGNVATLGSYSFSIPDSYQYETGVSGGYEALTVSDDPSNWVAIIAYEDDITFAQISSKIDEVGRRNCQDYGNTRVGSTDFYWCDMVAQGQYMTRWWSKAGSYVFETITAVNRDAYDHSLMDKVEPIISSATKRNITRSMNGDEDAEAASPFADTVKPSTIFAE